MNRPRTSKFVADAIDHLWIGGLLVTAIAAREFGTSDGQLGDEPLLLTAMAGGVLSVITASALRLRRRRRPDGAVP